MGGVVYALTQALRAMRSNWVSSFATITTMTLSLMILAGFSFVSLNLNRVLEDLQTELEITIYLNDDANPGALLETIASWPEVNPATLAYIPKEQSLERMMRDYPALRQAAALVGNPLPDSIELSLLDPLLTPAVSARLAQLPGVAEVEDGSDAVQTFLAINDSLRLVGSILVVILMGSSLLAIINSIRAAISARQKEIEVMKLVGATRGFIRAPFLLEGLLLGMISSAVSLGLALPGYLYVVSRLADELPFIPLVRDLELLGQVALLLFALGVLVGLVGSAISVTHNLREDI